MNRVILVAIMLIASSVAYSALSTITIEIPAGETRNIVADVPWPVDAARALLSPPAKVNGAVTNYVGFCVDSTVAIEGPTTVTIEYGSIDPVTSPDAIGGGE